jgi:hypothetical protein
MRQRTVVVLSLVLLAAACGRQQAQSVEESLREARSAHPDDAIAASNAGNARAREIASELLGSTSDKHEGAAIIFLGFHTKYAESLPKACSAVGAPIGKLATRFAELNKDFYDIALAFPSATATLERNRSSIDRAAQDELARMAASWQVDDRAACQFLDDNFEEFAKNASFAAVNPQAQQLLNQLQRR